MIWEELVPKKKSPARSSPVHGITHLARASAGSCAEQHGVQVTSGGKRARRLGVVGAHRPSMLGRAVARQVEMQMGVACAG